MAASAGFAGLLNCQLISMKLCGRSELLLLSSMPLTATHLVTRGSLWLFAVSDLKSCSDPAKKSEPIFTITGIASRRADLTSDVKISLGLVLSLAAAIRAEVTLLLCIWEEGSMPGIGTPNVSSTALTTLTKFFWTGNTRWVRIVKSITL